MHTYDFLDTHIEAVAWTLGVLFALIAIWMLLNNESFGRFLMRITVWRASPEKRASRRQALRSGLMEIARQRAPFVLLQDSINGFALTLSDPDSQTNPIWQWQIRWIGDHPFLGPEYEVEAIVNPCHLRIVRDKGVYKSAEWAVRVVARHLAQCASKEPAVRAHARSESNNVGKQAAPQ